MFSTSEKGSLKHDVSPWYCCVMHRKALLEFYRWCEEEGLLPRFFLLFFYYFNLQNRYILKKLKYVHLLECDRRASGCRRDNILNTTTKVIFRGICIKVPATHWLHNYLIVVTKKPRSILQPSIEERKSHKLNWVPYAINMWKQWHKCMRLLGGSDVHCFTKS